LALNGPREHRGREPLHNAVFSYFQEIDMPVDTSGLTAAMDASLVSMMEVMKTSIAYQTQTTEITTFLGQVASRAAKQTPQG
jgi:hypothetical protein